MADLSSSKSYQDLLSRLKNQIRTAQVRAVSAVNQELVLLYWGIGKEILARQRQDGWGTKVIERLAKDLRAEFPEMHGLSPRNLGYMKAFAEAWPDETILRQLAAKLPWFHNCVLLDKVKDTMERLWYIQQGHPERLEPERPGPSDRERPLSPARKGADKFSGHSSAAAVRSCTAAHQRSL